MDLLGGFSGPDPIPLDSDNKEEIDYSNAVQFVWVGDGGSGETYSADVIVDGATPAQLDTTTVGILSSNSLPLWNSTGVSNHDTNFQSFGTIDLHVRNGSGYHVGMNYSSGRYENEIKGAKTSGPGSYEWIAVPESMNATYSINTTGIKRFIEDRSDFNWSEVNLTSFYNFTFRSYGLYPSFRDVDGDYALTNTTKISTGYQPISPGSSAVVGVRPIITSAPRTLNLNSSGQFVTVNISTNAEVNLSKADLSTFTFNNVTAVHDDQYGFVRNPVHDGVLMLKFPRQEVVDTLELGMERRVTLKGKTTKNELLLGSTTIDVIQPHPTETE